MIETAYFENFKALRAATVPLSNLTLIVGPNASGKTSILQGLHLLAQLGTPVHELVTRGDCDPGTLRTSGASAAMTLRIEGQWNGTQGSLGLSLRGPADDGRIDWEYTVVGKWEQGKWKHKTIKFQAGSWGSGSRQHGGTFNDHPLLEAVKSTVLLHLDPTKLAEPSYSEAITPRVEFDGSNLSAALADMAIAVPQDYQQLLERIRAVVPPMQGLRLEKTKIEDDQWEAVKQDGEPLFRRVRTRSVGYRIVLDFLTGSGLGAAQASEGTLLTLGLLTILTGPARPRLVLIDEFERGLHPKALAELVRQIREIQRQFPDLQIVGTTHSPYLVDHFHAGEVVITALRDDGSVAVGALNQHPEFDRWKDEMSPGEFWSTVGEDWVRDS
ncbi:MAG TPA: AAA family ATPase [Phycisphaerae bacterium]|nr:AAA family ATPase [Phycisphaerae bacterium]